MKTDFFKTIICVVVVLSMTFFFSGCTDAERSSLSAFGDAAHITCYSGGKVIYEGDSTGKIATVSGSDGWEFRDAKTHKFIRVSGQCVIVN